MIILPDYNVRFAENCNPQDLFRHVMCYHTHKPQKTLRPVHARYL